MPRKRRSIEDDEEDVEHAVNEVEEMEEESTGENDEDASKSLSNKENDDDDGAFVDDNEEEQEEDDGDKKPAASTPDAKRPRHESTPRSAPRALNRPGEAAQVGIIQQIMVENFMCHRKLRVDLCRNINFIHGQNGSGKSAILAALQICLGANARRTNRARNLKGMVRNDHVNPPTHAKLSVTLRNEGEDAFRPEQYGKKITVERTISVRPGGFNGYKMFDENMQEVSRARKDLDNMLDHLNIQVENPVAILDQEEAKKFLTGKAADKYNFYMSACELERLDRTYANTADQLEDCTTAKERLADSMESEQRRVEELKKKYDQHRELDKLELRLMADQCKLAWAMWTEQTEELELAKGNLKTFQEKATKKKDELTQAELLSQQSTEGHDELSKRVEELTAEAQQLMKQKNELEAKQKEAMAPLRQQEHKVSQMERKLKQSKKELLAAQKRLQDTLHEVASNNKESEEARLAEALAKAEGDLAAARQENAVLRQNVADKLKLYEGLGPQVTYARRDHEVAERHYGNLRSKLEDLEKSSGDSLAMFGRNVQKVRHEIDRHRKEFTGPVVGPIGAYIKIQPGKEEYAALAEMTLGNGTLDRFIVTNNHDRRIVQQIRKKSGCRQDCGIFQMSTGSGRFSVPGSPVAGIETVASVLKIENDLVFNCLVDNCRIDQSALTKDRLKSEELLIHTDTNGDKKIKGNIRSVYCLPRGDMWTVKNGQKAVYSNERKLNPSVLGSDKSAAVAQLKREMQQAQSDVQVARREADRLEGEHTDYQRQWNECKRALTKNDKLVNHLANDKIESIKEQMEKCAGNTIDTSEFEEDVAQQNRDVAKYTEERQRALDELERQKPAVEEFQKQIRAITSQSTKVVKELENAEREVVKFLETQSQRKDAVAKKREKLQKYQEVINLHTEKIEKIQKEVDENLYGARKLQFRYKQRKEAENNASDMPGHMDEAGVPEPSQEELESIEPMQTDKDAEYYQARITRTEAKLEKERQNRRLTDEDPAEAYRKWIEAKNACSKKLDELAKLDETISEYQNDLKVRKKLWKKFRNYLSEKTSEKFQDVLSMNKYTGDLLFDHELKELNLNVRKQNSAATASNDAKGLSGGERSYTTIALLLALGEYLETPFRVMDEFDVFLDPQVRKQIIRTLIFTAKQMQHRQFIFITPQDLTGIPQDPQLKIFKLNPPERYDAVGPSQQTLNLTQQG